MAGTKPANSVSLAEEIPSVTQRVRAALARVVEALPTPVRRAKDLEEALILQTTLAWKVFNLIYGQGPIPDAKHIPGTSAFESFLRSANAAGVSPDLVDAARRARNDFEQLVRIHAGDRSSFDMMLAGCTTEGQQRIAIKHRKEAFRGNSYILGRQAKAQFKAFFVVPSADGRRLDGAILRGFVGLRRLRPDIPISISYSMVFKPAEQTDGVASRTPAAPATDPGSQRREVDPTRKREPLAPVSVNTDGSYSAPLLESFCSQPMPDIRRVEHPVGFFEDILVDDTIGETGRVTCALAEVVRAAEPRYATPGDRTARYVDTFAIPSEVAVIDLYLGDEVAVIGEPTFTLFATSPLRAWPNAQAEHDRLHLLEQPTLIGQGIHLASDPDVPRYGEMVQHVLDRLGWDAARFRHYRMRLRYPPTSSVGRFDVPLPEAAELDCNT
ncbi:MAG: hypothetical protein ABIG44_09760 [Planctomycetota bacterium]